MSGWWEELSQSLVSLLETHPLVVIGTILFFEELGVPSPIPGDVLMMLAGVKARQGYYPLWVILLVQELVTVAGTCGLYFFSRRFGRSLVQRYGWLLHLGPENLARAEAAIGRSGGRAIVVGRLLPGLRIATPIAAGVLGVPFLTFLPAISLGAFLYLGFFTLLGALLGPPALALFEHVALPTGALVSLATVFAFVFFVRRLKHELPTFARGGRGAAVAARLDGLLAGVVTLLAINGLLGVGGFVLQLLGRPVPVVPTEGSTGVRLLLGWPVFLILASLLGAFDERLGVERLAPLPRLLLTAGLPLALTLVIAVPLAQLNLIRFAVDGEGVVVATAALRWLVFGIVLGELLPLDAKVHQVRPASPVTE